MKYLDTISLDLETIQEDGTIRQTSSPGPHFCFMSRPSTSWLLRMIAYVGSGNAYIICTEVKRMRYACVINRLQ